MKTWTFDCEHCLYQTEANKAAWCEECRHAQMALEKREPTVQESLISKEALIVDLTAELRFAELKGSVITAMAFRKALDLVDAARVWGYVNPTQIMIYGEEMDV